MATEKSTLLSLPYKRPIAIENSHRTDNEIDNCSYWIVSAFQSDVLYTVSPRVRLLKLLISGRRNKCAHLLLYVCIVYLVSVRKSSVRTIQCVCVCSFLILCLWLLTFLSFQVEIYRLHHTSSFCNDSYNRHHDQFLLFVNSYKLIILNLIERNDFILFLFHTSFICSLVCTFIHSAFYANGVNRIKSDCWC